MSIQKVRGTQLYVKIGNDATPEVYTHPCLINGKRGIKFTSDSGKIVFPDCDNPDDPAWKETLVDGLAASIDGAGKLDAASVGDYTTWFAGGASKNVQVWLGALGYWSGAFKLTGFEVSGERNNYADASITLESDGAVAWTAA